MINLSCALPFFLLECELQEGKDFVSLIHYNVSVLFRVQMCRKNSVNIGGIDGQTLY